MIDIYNIKIDRFGYLFRAFKLIGRSKLFFCFSFAILLASVLVYRVPSTHRLTIDVSWPNCGRLNSIGNYSAAIVGTNGGLDFRANPCLGLEGRLTNNLATYANTGNPGFPRIYQLGKGPLNCSNNNRLLCYSFNYGYQAALYSLKQANLADVHSTFWWLDVESINSWTTSVAANRADIMGMVYALKTIRFLRPKIGIYTTDNQWIATVGHWKINLPLWLGTGQTNAQSAAKYCNQQSIIGSNILMTQYTIGKLDYDYRCF